MKTNMILAVYCHFLVMFVLVPSINIKMLAVQGGIFISFLNNFCNFVIIIFCCQQCCMNS